MQDFDADIDIMVPEYIVFRHETAGPVSRFFAVFLDIVAIMLIFIAVIVFLIFLGIAALAVAPKQMSPLIQSILLASFFLLSYFYFLIFEWVNRGRTPGKMLLGLRVVSLDGTALDRFQVVLRNLLRIADMFPFQNLIFTQLPSYLVGGVTAFVSGRSFQRLGDLAAGTIVIRERRHRENGGMASSDERIRDLAGRLLLRRIPAPGLARALSDFAARGQALGAARRDEIARAVEGPVRSYFGAEVLACTPEELLLAAHEYLYHLPRFGTGMGGVP